MKTAPWKYRTTFLSPRIALNAQQAYLKNRTILYYFLYSSHTSLTKFSFDIDNLIFDFSRKKRKKDPRENRIKILKYPSFIVNLVIFSKEFFVPILCIFT